METLPQVTEAGKTPLVSWLPFAAESLPDKDVPATEFVTATRNGLVRHKVEEIRAKFARAFERTQVLRAAVPS